MNVYVLRINNQSNKYFQVIQKKKKKKRTLPFYQTNGFPKAENTTKQIFTAGINHFVVININEETSASITGIKYS